MNKRISLLLVLSIILSMVAPMATYAGTVDTLDISEAEIVLDFVLKKSEGRQIKINGAGIVEENISILKDTINSIYDGLIDEIETEEEETKVIEVYKVNKVVLEELRDISNDHFDKITAEVFKNILDEFNEGEFGFETKVALQKLLNAQKEVLNTSGLVEDYQWREEVIQPGLNANETLDLAWKLLNKHIIGLEEVCKGQNKELKAKYELSYESTEETYNEIHPKVFLKTPEFKTTRYERMEAVIKKNIKSLEDKLNDKNSRLMREALKSIVTAFGFEYTGVEECPLSPNPPVTPPIEGGTGGTTGSTGEDTNKRYKTSLDDRTKPSKVYLELKDKDFKITVDEKNNNNVIVSINEKDIIDAIAQLKKEVKAKGIEEDGLKLVVLMPEEKGFHIDFVMTGKAANALKADNVAFKVEGDRGTITIPSGGLGETTFDDKELVKLRIDEIPSIIAVEKVRNEDAMKQAMDIYIERVKDDKVTRIDHLAKPMVFEFDIAGIGNTDLLAFYRIEDGMEFVTGKVRNNKLVYAIKDLGEHAIVETYFTYLDTKEHWAREQIKSMTAKNVVNGVGSSLFKPDENVTRAEFAKMIVSSLEEDLVAYNNQFKDVKKSDWFAPYIATAHKLGLVEGKSATEFKPDDNITREEMSAMLSRLSDEELTKEEIETELNKYVDAEKVSEWARPYVAKVSKLEIMTGKKVGLEPLSNATRAEAATTMFRIYNIY